MQHASKERLTNRTLVIRPKEGRSPKSSTGLIDQRIFTGENNLHVIQDKSSNLWSFKYDSGGLPEPLKERFSTFNNALVVAKSYFDKRDIQIVEVID